MRKLNIWKKGMYAVCGLLMAGVVTLQAGFISMAYPESGVINDTGVNIRSTADSGSTDNVMKRANENMEVSVLGEQTGTDGKTWLKVSYTEGGTERIGYVREDFVTLSTSSQTGNENADEEEQETQDETPAADKNPEGLTPIEGLDDDLTCYFNIDGSHYYINQGFTDSMIPDGFTRTEVEYRGDVIQMVKSNDIDFYLAYLTDYDDQSSSEWAFYDAEAQGFGYYIKLETMQGKYLYLLDTFGAGSMDFGYEKKDLEIDGKLVEAWQLMLEEEEDLTGENDCFYYVYGINQDGNKGLYSYYTKDGTYQRNILTGLEIVDDEYLSTEENTQLLETQIKELRDKYSTDMSKRLTLICVLLVVCVLLLFIVIHLALKLRRAGEEDYEDDEEDEDDEEELPGFRKRQTVSDETNDRTKRHLEKMIMDELDEEPEDELDEEPLPEIMDIQFAEVKDEIYEAPEDFEDDELEEDDFEEEEDEEEYVRPKRRGFFFGRRRDEEDEDDEDDYDEDEEEEEDEDEDEDEDEEEYVRPKRRGFFFGRRRDDEDDYEDDEDEDDFEDDEEYEDDFDDDEHYEDDSDLEDDYEDDEEYEEDYEDDEDDEEEYVKPKRRGFFFGRRRKDDYEEDDYDEEEEEDEDEDEDDYEEERMSWSRSRKAAKEEKARQKEAAKAQREKEKAEASARKSARRSRYEEDDLEEDAATRRANKKTKAADYAEKTVSARKSSRMPEPRFTDDDDDFEFEFIDLDDDF